MGFVMMSDLKQIKILSLKSLIIASLPVEYHKFLWSLSWCTHQILNHSKWTNNEEDMGLELERSLELCLQKVESNYHSSSCYVFCNAPLPLILKEQLYPSNLNIQWHIWLRNEENIEKCSMINTCSMMGSSTIGAQIHYDQNFNEPNFRLGKLSCKLSYFLLTQTRLSNM
jgi:hypothetical protein